MIIAKNNGADVKLTRPSLVCSSPAEIGGVVDNDGVEQFRESLIRASKTTTEFIITSFARSSLKQTGDGHFSPIAGYHEESDSVLILDVARFKYGEVAI